MALLPFLGIFAVLAVIFLPFVSALIVVLLAEKIGKSSILFQYGTFALAVVIAFSNFNFLFDKVFKSEFYVLSILLGTHEETVLVLLKNANKVEIKQSISDTDFDTPLIYLGDQYYAPVHGWQNVPKRQYEGNSRDVRSFIEIMALLPDLEPMSESNYKVFEALNGKDGPKVSAELSKQPSTPTDFYFKNSFSGLERQPSDPAVPGMLHYYESLGVNGRRSIYLSLDHASPDLTEIRCMEYKPEPPNPTCEVLTYFVYKGHRFGLSYSFAPTHLSQWSEIDRKVKTLFKHFGDMAQKVS